MKKTPFPTPCPWCHKKPTVEKDPAMEGVEELWWVICRFKKGDLPDHNVNVCDKTKEGAIVYWNKLVAR